MASLNKQMISKIRQYAKEEYSKNNDTTHDWDHICFVVNIAKSIARKEGMDEDIVEAGALLHDIGYPRFDEQKEEYLHCDHASISARKSETFLVQLGLDKQTIESIKDTIQFHSGNNITKSKSREAKAVYDADKLDVIGPRGLTRAVIWYVKYEIPDYPIEKIYQRALEDGEKNVLRMQTDTGKALAKKYMSYLDSFKASWESINQNASDSKTISK